MPVTIVDHPLVGHHLTLLRSKSTSSEQFRHSIARLTNLLAFEATKDLATEPMAIETPLTSMTGLRLSQRVGLVPILRAGLGMVEPMLDLLPNAEVWHLGLYRDEATAKPVEYYNKLPETDPLDVAMILDPMLATGGSASLAHTAINRWQDPKIKLLCIIASQAGVDRMVSKSPNTQIYACAVDEKLDSRKFIVPGLGDAGDRIFNTP